MSGANLTRNAVDIGRACMPLVRLLECDGLSWADRERIAAAITNNLRIYREHQAEQQHLQGTIAGAFAQGLQPKAAGDWRSA